MRLDFVLFGGHATGSQKQGVRLAQALTVRGHAVRVIFIGRPGPVADELDRDGLRGMHWDSPCSIQGPPS